MTARQRGWLLPPASLALVAGVFIGREVSCIFWPVAAMLSAISAVLLLKRTGRFIACIVFCMTLGFLAGTVSFHPALPEEGEYAVRGIVADEITAGSFGQVRVCLSDVSLDNRALSGGAYWTFYTDSIPDNLVPGKEVSFLASLYHPRGADNPDGYDFRETLLQRGITVGLYGSDELNIQDADNFSLSGQIASLRHRISRSLISSLGEETGSYASALLLGMRSLISSKDRESFSRLGIAHILSVSGFHVGLLIAAMTALFRLLRLRPSVRLLLYAVILSAYAALCGMNQPVIRASLLLLLSREGRILNRPRSGIHLLSAVLFIMTLFSPVQVTSASFQLTFCAVFGLIWFAPVVRRLVCIRSRVLRMIPESLVITFGVQLGLLFPELFFFQRLPLLVFLINLPAMLISGILIFLFWIVLFLLPLPGIAAYVSGILSAVTGWILSGIRYLGSLPGLTVWIHMPTVFTVIGILLIFLACCSFVRIRYRLRTVSAVLGIAVIVLSLLPVHHDSTEYIQFSAGNADAAVLWDQDKVYVIDTGEEDSTLSSFLRKHRLTPDAVILTHLHVDHAGGLRSMIDDEIPVKQVLLPAGAESQKVHPDFIDLLDDLKKSGTSVHYLSRGDVIPLPSGTFAVLWPESGKIRPGQDANQYSLVSRLSLKGTVLLQTGDIKGAYESYCSAPADILKAAHHGSPSSTTPAFLASVSPKVVLLSCQRMSRLHDFRERLDDIPVYGTPESGALTIRFEEGYYTVIPFLHDQIIPEEYPHGS